jgi:Zn-dependent hydrolases, including glyoxylases
VAAPPSTQERRPVSAGAGAFPVELTEVADGVWCYAQHDGSWWINTTGFVVGSRVVAVDACATERRTRAFVDAVQRVAGRSADLLVNTHSHGDHTFGNSVFNAATVLIATDAAGRELQSFADRLPVLSEFTLPDYERTPTWGDVSIRLADITFGERLDLHLDGPDLQLLHFGVPAHTAGDLVAWIPSRRVLFAGDLIFNGGMPLAVGGSVSGAIQTLQAVRALEPDVIVPGHGAPCGIAQIDLHLRYWHFVQKLACAGFEARLDPVATARDADLGEFAALSESERLVMNLHRAWVELDPAHAFDMASATHDAVLLSGHPIRCRA